MTTAPVLHRPAPLVDECDGVQWRRLGHRLWVGRTEDRPVGTIERGRRYSLIGEDGVVRGVYRTLEAAQSAAAQSAAARPAALAAPTSPAFDLWTHDARGVRFGALAWTTSLAGVLAVGLSVTGVLTIL